ncbi:uncharacterized protein BKCO1_14000168 [Diplodia corticola]|uniref:Luciferase domain-containing protein n=1 Tax=Diplodia corticola TaxID=236234 RepID=A0A1J9S8K0_9PEZI|nr:uncharacterized protein BKCO1_14000168 [Diplodia corticola]OJD35909.1 hypothetical protein BKCO1_14000168 [Diplodia corticola]
MDHLRRLIPPRFIPPTTSAPPRSYPPILLTTSAAVLAAPLIIYLSILDYREFLALGPGGVPYNLLGWAGITLLIRPFALSKAQATRTDDYPQDDGAVNAEMLGLPRRRGERARVGGIAPHRQLDQFAGEGMGEFIRNLFANAAVQNPRLLETKTSLYERHNDALFVRAELLRGDAAGRELLPRAALMSGGEIGHVHGDLSVHLYLAPADARVLIEKGWAERHRMAVPMGSLVKRVIPIFGRIADTFLMFYGPRDEEEMEVLQTVLTNSIRFMTGRDDFAVPEWRVRRRVSDEGDGSRMVARGRWLEDDDQARHPGLKRLPVRKSTLLTALLHGGAVPLDRLWTLSQGCSKAWAGGILAAENAPRAIIILLCGLFIADCPTGAMTRPPSPPSPEMQHLADNAPVLVQWKSTCSSIAYLGCELPTSSSQVAANIKYDASERTCSFRLRVPVGLKEPAGKKAHLYLFLCPDQIHSIDNPADNAPQPGTNILVAKTKACTSPDDVVALRIQLKQPMTAVGPVGLKQLAPNKAASGRILEAVHSLLSATDLTIHLPKNNNSYQFEQLCQQASDGALRPRAHDYALDMLYGGSGGEDVGHLLAQFDKEVPPPYDAPASASTATACPTADPLDPKPPRSLKRPASPTTTTHTSSASAPAPKSARTKSPTPPPAPLPHQAPDNNASPSTTTTTTTALDVDARITTALQPWHLRLSSLEHDLCALRSEIALSGAVNAVDDDAPPTSPTEDDRLDAFDAEIRALRDDVRRVERLLLRQESLRRSGEARVLRRLEERFGDRMDEWEEKTKGEVEGEVDEALDGKLVDWKVEMRDWIGEELRGVVEEGLQGVVEEVLERSRMRVEIVHE